MQANRRTLADVPLPIRDFKESGRRVSGFVATHEVDAKHCRTISGIQRMYPMKNLACTAFESECLTSTIVVTMTFGPV